MPTRAAARILLVDDDASVLDGLTRALLREHYEVIAAMDGETGLRLARSEHPDLIILDVVLPGLDGLAVCEQLRSTSTTPIMMLTARDTLLDKVLGLERGADDYLPKPFAVQEFVARVRAMLRRTPPPRDDSLTYSGLRADLRARKAYWGSELVPLTSREFELLVAIMRRPAEALSRDQLARLVWGYEPGRASNFVDVTVGRLRQKLEAGGRRRLIHAVRGFGYVLSAE